MEVVEDIYGRLSPVHLVVGLQSLYSVGLAVGKKNTEHELGNEDRLEFVRINWNLCVQTEVLIFVYLEP